MNVSDSTRDDRNSCTPELDVKYREAVVTEAGLKVLTKNVRRPYLTAVIKPHGPRFRFKLHNLKEDDPGFENVVRAIEDQ